MAVRMVPATVFVVIGHVDYESSDVLSVHKTAKEGDAAAERYKQLQKQPPEERYKVKYFGNYDRFSVEEFEVSA